MSEHSVAQLAERRMRQWAIGLEVQQRLQHEAAAKSLSESVHPYLTISRDTGAGAGELAHRVGKILGWEVLDRELLDYMAKQYHSPWAPAHDCRFHSRAGYLGSQRITSRPKSHRHPLDS